MALYFPAPKWDKTSYNKARRNLDTIAAALEFTVPAIYMRRSVPMWSP